MCLFSYPKQNPAHHPAKVEPLSLDIIVTCPITTLLSPHTTNIYFVSFLNLWQLNHYFFKSQSNWIKKYSQGFLHPRQWIILRLFWWNGLRNSPLHPILSWFSHTRLLCAHKKDYICETWAGPFIDPISSDVSSLVTARDNFRRISGWCSAQCSL